MRKQRRSGDKNQVIINNRQKSKHIQHNSNHIKRENQTQPTNSTVRKKVGHLFAHRISFRPDGKVSNRPGQANACSVNIYKQIAAKHNN